MIEKPTEWGEALENQEVFLLDSPREKPDLDPQTVQELKALLLRLEQERVSIRMSTAR